MIFLRRGFFAALLAPLLAHAPSRRPASPPEPRFALVGGASMVSFYPVDESSPHGRDYNGLLALADPMRPDLPAGDQLLYRLVPAAMPDPTTDAWPQDRGVGVCMTLQVGTIDELVAEYRRGLEAAAASVAEFPGVGSTQAVLAQAGICEFRKLPAAAPDVLAAREAKRAMLRNLEARREHTPRVHAP